LLNIIIFLYGPDTFRSKQKLKEIIERYKKVHQSGLNLKHFDFKKDSFENYGVFRFLTMFKEKTTNFAKCFWQYEN
jgi:UTP-glucose-1-phosphate uridylyltransferase